MGACSSYNIHHDIPWLHTAHAEQLEDIACEASNNYKLTQIIITRMDSGQATIAEIRTFLSVSQQAWSEHAQKVSEELDRYEHE